MQAHEIVRLAKEASFDWDDLGLLDRLAFYQFADLVAAAEREKCAQLVETYEKAGNTMGAPEFVMVFKDCAAAIRARKEKQ